MKQAFDPHRYAMALTRRGYGSGPCGLYRWTGTFWQLLDEQAAKRDAYHWLVKHDRDHASERCATAAVRAAWLWVDAVPAATDDVIVPCRNGYVVLDHQRPVLIPAEPHFGLQYVLVPVNMLTQGGPDQGSSNLVYIIYQYAFTFFKAGTSAAYAVITMVCYLAFLFVKNKYLEKKVYYEN